MQLKDHYKKSLKSPKLQAIIVEPILLSCANGTSIYQLKLVLQRLLILNSSSLSSLPSSKQSYNTLKKYLFYLINYDLIKYNGQRQIYELRDEGFDFLDWIKREKKDLGVEDNKDILITME